MIDKIGTSILIAISALKSNIDSFHVFDPVLSLLIRTESIFQSLTLFVDKLYESHHVDDSSGELVLNHLISLRYNYLLEECKKDPGDLSKRRLDFYHGKDKSVIEFIKNNNQPFLEVWFKTKEEATQWSDKHANFAINARVTVDIIMKGTEAPYWVVYLGKQPFPEEALLKIAILSLETLKSNYPFLERKKKSATFI